MKKNIIIYISLVLMSSTAHAVSKVGVSGWGSFTHNDGGSLGEFVLKETKADLHNSSTDTEEIMGIVAEKISKNGGCFSPVVIRCIQGNHGRWGGHMQYKTFGVYPTCQWLCADGYSGVNCEKKAEQTSTESNYPFISKTQRDNILDTVQQKLTDTMSSDLSFADKIKAIADTAIDKTSSIQVLDDYEWWSAGDKRTGNVILGLIEYKENGVIAAPVRVQCIGDRSNIWHPFDGTFSGNSLSAGGTSRLLCAEGWQPNANKTDCVRITKETIEASIPKVTEIAPDGSAKTYKGERLIALVNAQKARKGYDAAVHSVYNYSGSETNPTFGVFCKDHSKGLESTESLKCIDCSPELKQGVCLGNSLLFGVCSQCRTGQIYDENTCSCKEAQAYSMSDLTAGKGRQASTDLTNACWSKDDPQEYKDCVKNETPALKRP